MNISKRKVISVDFRKDYVVIRYEVEEPKFKIDSTIDNVSPSDTYPDIFKRVEAIIGKKFPAYSM